MPIYEYRCNKCEATDEVLQKVSDPAPEECPSCGTKKSMEKLISQTSFQLKGGGWYKDLYSSTKPAQESKDKPKKKAESKASKSTETKKAKKTAAA